MTGRILKREFLNNIQSFRFFTLFALAIILFTINAFISSREFQRQLAAYSKNVAKHSGYSSDLVSVDRHPNPLVFVTDGQSRKQDMTLDIHRAGNITPDYSEVVYRGNFLLHDFEVIDWTFIIKLLFSIFAILLTFDAICGEKERGTLRLVCSNSVPRGRVILGKYTGAMLTLIVPLFAGILVNIIVINFLGTVDLDTQMAARVGLIVLLGLIYLSVFVLLGLFISSTTHRAPTSLLVNLGIWLILIVIVPTLAGIAGENLSRVPTESEFLEREEEIMRIYRDPAHAPRLLQDIVRKNRLTEVGEIQKEAVKLLTRAAEERIKLNQDIWRAVESRENLARDLARISPPAAFQFAAESLAFAGVMAERDFYRAAQNFVKAYQDYIRDKTGVVYRFNGVFYRPQIEVGGETLSISVPGQPRLPEELKDFPRFRIPRPSISDSFQHGLLDIIVLMLWNLLLFLSSVLLFIRYDVR